MVGRFIHLQLLLLSSSFLWIGVISQENGIPESSLENHSNGDAACTCLSASEVETLGSVLVGDYEGKIGSDNQDIERYGIGCAPHDETAVQCSDVNQNDCTSIVPLPADCDKSFCARRWCYVSDNDQNCTLLKKASNMFRGRYYSYATCGELDRFTYTERLKSVKGQTFQVGFTSNSGGWKGGFHPEGTHFTPGNNNVWYGPIVDFVQEAARVGRL